MSTEKMHREYPRALPFRAPAKPVDGLDLPASVPTDAMSNPGRWPGAYWLTLTFAALTLVGGGIVVGWSLFGERPASVETTAASAPTPSPGPALAVPQPAPEARNINKPKASGVSPLADKTGPDAAVAVAIKNRYLEALGSMCAAHLYQSFLNIGLLADGVENEQLSLAEGEKTLANVVRFMGLVERQLDQIAMNGLDPNDRQTLLGIQGLAKVLRKQADALQAYWSTGAEDQAGRYHEARNQALAGLGEMLGPEILAMEWTPGDDRD